MNLFTSDIKKINPMNINNSPKEEINPMNINNSPKEEINPMNINNISKEEINPMKTNNILNSKNQSNYLLNFGFVTIKDGFVIVCDHPKLYDFLSALQAPVTSLSEEVRTHG